MEQRIREKEERRITRFHTSISRKTQSVILLVIVISLAQIGVVYGDGFGVRRPRNIPNWEYSEEENQICYIEHLNGVETMLLSIDTSVGVGEMVWIFPVPATPETVDIGLSTVFPTLKGVNIGETSKKVLHLAIANARNKVFIPLPEDFPKGGGTYSMGGFSPGANQVDSEEVTVYETVNQLGVTSLLLDASSGEALETFLLEYDVVFPTEAQSVVDEYIRDDYCFVVSWVYNDNLSSGHSLSIKVNFPTDNPYFPLRLTSVYGDTTIPITVYLKGHWIPTLQSISKYSDVDYYTRATINAEHSTVSIKDTTYTRLSINSPSYLFSDDTWFKKGITVNGWFSLLILENQFITWSIIEVLLFGVASLLSAIAVLGTDIPKVKYFLLGVFNVFTLVTLGLAYLLIGAHKPGNEVHSYTGGLFSDHRYRVPYRGLVFDARVVLYLLLFVPLMLSLSVILEYGASVLL